MSKADFEKLHQAMLLTKALTTDLMHSDPVYVELATAFACICRARKLALERTQVPA